jgi:hypothetical protein
VRAFKLAAPVAGAVASGQDTGALGPAIGALAQGLQDADLDAFAKAFGNAASYCLVDEQGNEKWVPLVEQNQGLHFAGRPDAFFAWLMLAMEANGFFRFFSGQILKEAAGNLMQSTPG